MQMLVNGGSRAMGFEIEPAKKGSIQPQIGGTGVNF